MSGPDIAAMQRNAAKIGMADVVRAYLHPGKKFGSLHKYIDLTIYMESTRTFVISRSGRDVRAPNDGAAVAMVGQACGDALAELRQKDPVKFIQAADFINGAGVRDAETFLASPK